MILGPLSDWLYQTSLSQSIQSIFWVIPTIQTVHILAIAVLTGSAIMMNMKLVGVTAREDSYSAVFDRYAPWMKWAIIVLAISGSLLIIGEPERVLFNWSFWVKMAFVLTGILLLILARRQIRRLPVTPGAQVPATLRLVGGFAIIVWVHVIILGRWIAYAVG